MKVHLSPAQIQEAKDIALKRTQDSLRRGCKDRRGYVPGVGDFVRQAKSVMAEMAVALVLLVSFTPTYGNVNGEPDLREPCEIDVKSTDGGPFLHVEPAKLRDDWVYSLVHVTDFEGGECDVKGFTTGAEIKSRGELKAYDNARPPVFRIHSRYLQQEPNCGCPF